MHGRHQNNNLLEYSRKDIIDILKVPPEKVVKNYNSIDNH